MKLINYGTIIIKPADKVGAVLIDLNLDMKIHKILKKLLHKHNSFTESKQKFLNKNFFETSNFYGLPKIHKSTVTEAAIHSQNTEVVEIWKSHNLKLRTIVSMPNCSKRRLIFIFWILILKFFGFSFKAISKEC